MSDFEPGLSVTATRQNDPSFANGFCPPGGPPARPLGGVNAPGATVCAMVTTPCGTASDVRLSHVAADADGTLREEHSSDDGKCDSSRSHAAEFNIPCNSTFTFALVLVR